MTRRHPKDNCLLNLHISSLSIILPLTVKDGLFKAEFFCRLYVRTLQLGVVQGLLVVCLR